MGIAVVRRQPSFLETLGQRMIPQLFGMMMQQGQQQARNKAEQAYAQDLFASAQNAPTPAPIDITPQAPTNPWEKAMGGPATGGSDAGWINTWDAAHPGTTDPLQLLTHAAASEYAGKYGLGAAMQPLNALMPILQGQQQQRIASAQQGIQDNILSQMENPAYAWRNPGTVFPDLARYGSAGGNLEDLTPYFKHMVPGMEFNETNLGDSTLLSSFDPFTGAVTPLGQPLHGVDPDTRFSQNAQIQRTGAQIAAQNYRHRSDPMYQAKVAAYTRYKAGEATPEDKALLGVLGKGTAPGEKPLSASRQSSIYNMWAGKNTSPFDKNEFQAAIDAGVSLEDLFRKIDLVHGANPQEAEYAKSLALGLKAFGRTKNPWYGASYPSPSEDMGGYTLQAPTTGASPETGSATPLSASPPSAIAGGAVSPPGATAPQKKKPSHDTYINLAQQLKGEGWSDEQILAEALNSGHPEAVEVIRKFLSSPTTSGRKGSPRNW